ncbi:hypothetical protein [Geodermatophilus sp. SYSU D00815]
MQDKTAKGDPTPRKLIVSVELDVTEGPRLRKNMTGVELQQVLGDKAEAFVRNIAEGDLGLKARESRTRVQWQYAWLDNTRPRCFTAEHGPGDHLNYEDPVG